MCLDSAVPRLAFCIFTLVAVVVLGGLFFAIKARMLYHVLLPTFVSLFFLRAPAEVGLWDCDIVKLCKLN